MSLGISRETGGVIGPGVTKNTDFKSFSGFHFGLKGFYSYEVASKMLYLLCNAVYFSNVSTKSWSTTQVLEVDRVDAQQSALP